MLVVWKTLGAHKKQMLEKRRELQNGALAHSAMAMLKSVKFGKHPSNAVSSLALKWSLQTSLKTPRYRDDVVNRAESLMHSTQRRRSSAPSQWYARDAYSCSDRPVLVRGSINCLATELDSGEASAKFEGCSSNGEGSDSDCSISRMSVARGISSNEDSLVSLKQIDANELTEYSTSKDSGSGESGTVVSQRYSWGRAGGHLGDEVNQNGYDATRLGSGTDYGNPSPEISVVPAPRDNKVNKRK
ncbi:MAG: hypothetical protein SGPRY_012378, partial [Prymnesium sp.]